MTLLTVKSLAILCNYSISGLCHRLAVALTHQCTLVVAWVAAVTWDLVALDHITDVSFYTLVFFNKVHRDLDGLCASVSFYWRTTFSRRHGISLFV